MLWANHCHSCCVGCSGRAEGFWDDSRGKTARQRWIKERGKKKERKEEWRCKVEFGSGQWAWVWTIMWGNLNKLESAPKFDLWQWRQWASVAVARGLSCAVRGEAAKSFFQKPHSLTDCVCVAQTAASVDLHNCPMNYCLLLLIVSWCNEVQPLAS